MRDLDRVLIGGHQPLPIQVVEHSGDGLGVGGWELGEQRVAAHPAPGVLRVWLDGDHPQEQPLGHPLPALVEAGVQSVGRGGEGVLDAACGLVGGDSELAVLAAGPGLAQGVRQQRQLARIVGGDILTQRLHRPEVAQHRGGQPGLHGEAHLPGRRFDGLPQLLGHHRPDGQRVGQGRHQAGMGGTALHEGGAHAEDHQRGGRIVQAAAGGGAQRVDEPPAFIAVAALGEDLLELVDHQDQPPVAPHRLQVGTAAPPLIAGEQPLADDESRAGGVGGELHLDLRRRYPEQVGKQGRQVAQRGLARRHHLERPVPGAWPVLRTGHGQTAVTQLGYQPGPQQRRLARARGAHHDQRRRAVQPLAQPGE